jgi:carbonic anhydrase
MKAVDIVYHYAAHDASTRAPSADSDAALLRLNDGNREFAALLDRVKDDDGVIKQIIPVDPRDLGLVQDGAGSLQATSVCRRAWLFGCPCAH